MRVLFAGGGTGGHLYPAIAVAREILRRDPEAAVLFAGTVQGIESAILPREGLELKTIRIAGLKRKRKMEQILTLFTLPSALVHALAVVRNFRPDVAMGVGGFVSGPLILAAWLLRKSTSLQEQNSVPGLTNRILARFADRIYTAFDGAENYFPKGKVLLTGNPLREGVERGDRSEALARFGFDPDRKTVLVLGGSRGAHAINRLLVKMIREPAWSDLPVQFLHQTGREDAEEVRRAYNRSGIRAEVRAFFDRMDWVYAAADLVVSRAGAMTLSEICAAGIPSLLIPFPFAADDHQTKNASILAGYGAAEVLPQHELGPGDLGIRIRTLLEDPGRLARMREAALKWARPDAVRVLVDDLERRVRRGVTKTRGSRERDFPGD